MTTLWELLPFVGSALLTMLGHRTAHLISGRAATVVLATSALICALATGLVLCSLGTVAAAHWEPLASLGHLSIAAVSSQSPMPTQAALACGVVGVLLLAASVVRLMSLVRDSVRSHRLCRRLGGDATGLVVVDSGDAQAYALSGRPGRIVLSRTLLRALSGPERSAVLAHERSHLSRRHIVYSGAIRLAATANPMLRSLVTTVDLAIERWADADAARHVRDPDVVMRALAVTGLMSAGRIPRMALSATGDIAARLRSLQAARHPAASAVTIVLVGLASACAISSLAVGLHVHGLVEWAQLPHRRR